MIVLTDLSNILSGFGDVILKFAPQITIILTSFLAIIGTRKQSAREYLAKSRSDSLNKTKDQFGEFVSVIYRIWGYKVNGATYQVSAEAMDRKNIAILNLETSFNPMIDEHQIILELIKDIEARTMKLEGEIVVGDKEFGEKNQENSDIINEEIKPLMDKLKHEMQMYFYNEWEKIKQEIKFKK